MNQLQSMSAAAATTAAAGGGATAIDDLHPDVLTGALRRLDGPALAAASCATSHLRSLSSNPDLWRDLCLSAWPSLRLLPSLPVTHRSLFSDALPFPSPSPPLSANLPPNLISAVDLRHRDAPILSRIIRTDTSTPWFLSSPFRVDALDRKDLSRPPEAAAASSLLAVPTEELTLSWILIDPASGRAVNASSRRPVAVERHWYTGETLVKFAAVMGVEGGECAATAVVACGEETGQVREVSLTVEDMDGICLGGRESLAAIMGAMEGVRTLKGGEEAAAERYVEHLGRRRRRKERRLRREGMLDLCCSAVGVAVFLAFLAFLAFR